MANQFRLRTPGVSCWVQLEIETPCQGVAVSDTARKILMLHGSLSLRGMDRGEDFTSEMGGVLTESMSHFQLVKVNDPHVDIRYDPVGSCAR